jgi:hypothetical protein
METARDLSRVTVQRMGETVGTTRRQFLARGGVIAGVLAAGSAATVLPSDRGGSAEAAGLTVARRRTYTALIEAVAAMPSVRLDPSVAGAATDDFAAAYDAWPDERRAQADALLDALERVPAGGFSGMARERRGAELRARCELGHARPTAAEHERLDLARRALELTAVALGPPDAGHVIVTV